MKRKWKEKRGKMLSYESLMETVLCHRKQLMQPKGDKGINTRIFFEKKKRKGNGRETRDSKEKLFVGIIQKKSTGKG